VVAEAYTVERRGNQLAVTVRFGAMPLALVLGTDGSLSGTGSVLVAGRAVSGLNADGSVRLVARTATCAVGVLTAGR
jgi:hypothetical protein